MAVATNQSHLKRLFQSTPVTADGRTDPGLAFVLIEAVFQSTPVTADGRTSAALIYGVIRMMFQSTPVTADGRTGVARGGRKGFVFVSIHARHC